MSDADRAAGTPRGMRLRGMIRKEMLQIARDPSSLAIAFVLPMVLLLLFGFGVSLDAKHVPIAVVVETSTAEAADFAASFEQSEYFRPVRYRTIQEAERDMIRGDVNGMVWLRSDFGSGVLSADGAPISVTLNGVDANTARMIAGYVRGAWAAGRAKRTTAVGSSAPPAVILQSRVWFNPGLRSRDFLIPGLIAVIMTLIGALLTAMVMAREWERGTMEALLVTPVTIREILLGKLLPYFLLGMGGLTLAVHMAIWIFGVPLRGSFFALYAGSALFLIAALGMGLSISTVARNQFVAGQLAIVATFLPAFMLSGFIFDIHSMPRVIQILTHLIAARYYVALLQTVFLAGDIWPVILAESAALVVFCLIFFGVARKRTTKRLD